jgi:hypothetical protein
VTVTNPDTQSGTGTGVFTVNAGPTVTSTTPNSAVQGATNLNVTVTGTNFVTGATANFGTGITVNSTTFVSATSLTANITISAVATTGARNVTVTNPDQGAGTGTGVFTVTAGANTDPAITSSGVSPVTGDTVTTYTFTLVYTDANNDAPAAGYPKVYIGDADGVFAYTMTLDTAATDPLLRDGNYANGEQYVYRADLGAALDIRYYFEVQAATGVTTIVSTPPVVNPAVSLLYSQNLVGVPKDLGAGAPYSTTLGDDTAYPWCQTYVSTGLLTGSYVDCTNGNLQTGKGYFIWATLSGGRLDAVGRVNVATATFDIPLQAGWNLISNPYTERMALQAAAPNPRCTVVRNGVESADFSAAVTSNWVGSTIYDWQATVNGYVGHIFNGTPPAVLEPWKGYWIYVPDSTFTTMSLRVYR